MTTALIIAGVVVALFVVVGLLLPTRYGVSATTTVNAPRQRVHELIADLEQWEHWEPWREKDPTIEITRGQTTGVGAHQQWADKSGGGELTFTRSDSDYGIDYDLLFAKKYACKASMTHRAVDEGRVEVTWSMSGDTGTPIIGGYFARLMPKLIRPMFQRGLDKLKLAAEAQ